jgi:hypothetical protein
MMLIEQDVFQRRLNRRLVLAAKKTLAFYHNFNH